MSHTLFTRAPALRIAAQRALPRGVQHAYHSASGPTMQAGAAPLRSLIRQTTLGATAVAAQRSSYPLSQQFSPPTYSTSRPRTPSPPPPYHARTLSLLASTTHWTRFPTPSTALSSVRTFTRTAKHGLASEAPGSKTAPLPTLPPDAQAAVDAHIEHISDLYGTARDEFEIAAEETEKNTMYAPDDRAAAREELDRLVEYYRGVVEAGDVVGNEVRRRLGGRIRELEGAVKALEEAALHHD